MTRVMRTGGLLLAAAVLPLVFLPEPSAGQIVQIPVERPNVIVIVTDDQREGLEVMPSTRRLFADEGVDFPNAFVTTPLCCPARASIMTGQYVHNHGVLSNGEDDWRDLDESNTIQAKLDAVGYRTGLFGKFLNHWPTSRVPQHFDEWWLLPDVVGRTGYYGATWNINGTLQKIDTYSTTYLRNQAVEFIEAGEAADDEPFYMYIAVAAAHRSFVPEPRYEGAPVPRWTGNPAVFETNKRDKPAYVRNSEFTFKEGKKRRAAQFRTLMSVDDMVAAIYDALEATEEDNTLSIFVSDSGYLWGEHGLTNKQVPYEQSIKMPMMLRWPEHGSDDDDRLVTNVDIAPTIYAAAGVTATTDGRDLLDPSWNRDRILLE
ncbi:MAG TPA: sulfatase, partial [Actinomycetota bacterium]|nr:sulfatase [Actinomycetota bacterium]